MKCVAWTCSLLALAVLSGCKTKSVTQLEYMPDMARQISVRAQEFDPTAPGGIAMRQPVAGTVPRGSGSYPYGLSDTTEADRLVNPLPATAEVLEAGRKYFNTYCIVCHGAGGAGDGFIIPKFTQPPPLFSDKVVNWPDGRIYHTITLGQGLMSSYASQLLPEQRWAVIRYVRQLQQTARLSDVAGTEKKTTAKQ